MNIVQPTGNITTNEAHPDDDSDSTNEDNSTDEDTVSSGSAESQNEAPTECQVI